MAKTYSCEITAKRVVALDGAFQCATCGYASPMRVWGEGEAKRTHRSGHTMWANAKPITEIPAPLKTEAKKEAEARAWANAQARTPSVRCPRCFPNGPPWASFLVR